MHLPKPRDGWRAFAGEVGVIVLGVLLALGAQQAVENWQVRQDVKAFRETIDREIGYNMVAQEIRLLQVDCSLQRLAAMEAWLERSRSGESMPGVSFAGNLRITPYRAAWQNRDAETFRHLPADVRQKYALFYDGDDNLQQSDFDVSQAIRQLARFAEPGPVSLAERRDARVPLRMLRGRLVYVRENTEAQWAFARELGIKPVRPPIVNDADYERVRQCSPIDSPRKS